jgi:uncharacterized protein YjbJ (UPF0337 family)
MSLDQVTKQRLQQKLRDIKPQLKRDYPDLSESDLNQAESDPDRFVSTIEQKTGQPRDQVERRLSELVGGR